MKTKEHGNFRSWNKALQDTPESYKEWFRFEEAYLRENVKGDSRVLEVGCGDGRSLAYLAGNGSTLFGIDYDTNAGLLARDKLGLIGLDANILYMEANDLLFKDGIFDYVLSLSTPANFGNQKKQIYSEMRRVLKPEGEIILNVFNEDAFDERMKFYKKSKTPIKEVRGTTVVFEDENKEFTSEQFSREQLETLCEESDLVPIDISKRGIGYLCRFGKIK